MAPTELWDRRNQRAVPVWLVIVVVALVAGRIVLSQTRSERAQDDLVQWVSLAKAEDRARRTGKPIMYDFTAEWCAPCHQLDEAVFRDPRLAAMINARFIPVRVTDRMQEEGRNSPEVAALQQRYSVRAFPTVVFVDRNGVERGRMEGFGGVRKFEQVAERLF